MLIRMLKTGGWWCWKSGFPVIGTRGRACEKTREDAADLRSTGQVGGSSGVRAGPLVRWKGKWDGQEEKRAINICQMGDLS